MSRLDVAMTVQSSGIISNTGLLYMYIVLFVDLNCRFEVTIIDKPNCMVVEFIFQVHHNLGDSDVKYDGLIKY